LLLQLAALLEIFLQVQKRLCASISSFISLSRVLHFGFGLELRLSFILGLNLCIVLLL
jgi:hypothetical protein